MGWGYKVALDVITKNNLNEFSEAFGFEGKKDWQQFEHFVNYSIFSESYRSSFKPEQITTGGGNDAAIDGVAITINSKLISSIEEVDDICSDATSIIVDLLFTQSKTATSFDGAEIGNFLDGVLDFCSPGGSRPMGESITKKKEIWLKIIEYSAKMIERLPNCKCYYACVGKWQGDAHLESIFSQKHALFESFGLFHSITILPIDKDKLRSLYQKTKAAVEATFVFNKKITLPAIEGISEAHFGVIPLEEFKKIICDADGNVMNIFEDNIRDFQGDNNAVNKRIRSTLNSENPNRFSVLNNGVTVVASSMTPLGEKYTIRDYQIVNGCQTSNVIASMFNELGEADISIPIRIISTENEEVKAEITFATNNQTEVKAVQLESLNEFQKGLEAHYSSVSINPPAYYERRSQQYNRDPRIKKIQVVNIENQIKSFASMFLDAPHDAVAYFGTIRKKHEDKIFNPDHRFEPYFLSGYAFMKLENLFRAGLIGNEYKTNRYHILMAFKHKIAEVSTPPLNSKKMTDHCQKVLDVIVDTDKFKEEILEIISRIETNGYKLTKDRIKSSSVTENIKYLFTPNPRSQK